MSLNKDYSSNNSKPLFYATFYNLLREIAYHHGYALALHGSLLRDMDLIAVPWIETLKPHEEMVVEMAKCVGGYMIDERPKAENNPTIKPHGRLAYTIHIGAGAYIDLSIMTLS